MAGGRRGKGPRGGSEPGAVPRGGAAGEATLGEFFAGAELDDLREFLAADFASVDADPEFKERLRRELWELVLNRIALGRSDPEGGA